MPTSILIIEDDERLAQGICAHLQSEGYQTSWIADGLHASQVDLAAFDLVVLDLMLPGRHGFDLLKEWREHSDIPVIVLTARSDSFDKVRGLSLGADDYVTKPFWPAELSARILARLRRPTLARTTEQKIGAITIETHARMVKIDGREIDLTRVEFDLLAILARRVEEAVSRRQLAQSVLEDERDSAERTLDVHISRVRRKLGAAAMHLETVWGIGYRLTAVPKGATR
jgi:two-component system response regulator MtrA